METEQNLKTGGGESDYSSRVTESLEWMTGSQQS